MTDAVKAAEHWLTSVVIELGLCPFAKREYHGGRVRFKESMARGEADLLADLVLELSLLGRRPEIETTLLIHPHVLTDFKAFNQFLSVADALIQELRLDGVFQLASFHPDYQFAGTDHDAVENYTNRSPFPILQILREQSLERAIKLHPNTAEIPENNIRLMNELGGNRMQQLLQQCKLATNS